jgi:hypothetical protein
MAQVVRKFVMPISMEENWADYEDLYKEGIKKITSRVYELYPEHTKLVGVVLKFSVMGGYGHYMVVRENPLELAFIDVDGGLASSPQFIRKLTLEKVQQIVDRERTVMQNLYPWLKIKEPENALSR